MKRLNYIKVYLTRFLVKEDIVKEVYLLSGQ